VMTHLVFLSLGSNINRETNIKHCLIKLQEIFGSVESSPVYESEPVGFKGEHFYNLTVKITTEKSLIDLTKILKLIEDENGRVRGGERFSSRTLDIDILTYDDLCGVYDSIELPRPEIFFNAFVLLPMSDLAADYIEPKSRLSYEELWSERKNDILTKQKLWPVNFEWPQGVKGSNSF
jgi:2-amino-4-hydroxy-6-hydroxymethyldihydropteridine diphosphokinase